MLKWTLVILFTAASAMTAASRPDPTTEAVDALMHSYSGNVPGASVLVVRNGKVALAKSYGMADVEKGIVATPATNYRLASMTKQFTATAIEILAERHRLELEGHVRDYLPSLPGYADDITIRQLLNHTSGLPDYEDLIPAKRTEQVSDQDVLHLIEETSKPLFQPGSRWQYSNTGYVFLGLIVEEQTGLSFPDFLAREIFKPLKMKNSVLYEKGTSTVASRAYGYSQENGHWVQTDQSVTSATRGDGGIYTSINDLHRWELHLEKPRILHPATLMLGFTPGVASDDPAVRYGFGWRISEHAGKRTQWHSGETMGFRNVIVRFPDQRLAVVVLTNRNDPEPYQTALAIADLYLQK